MTEEQNLYEEQKREIELLRAALNKCLIGGNHIATYKNDNWPAVGHDHALALDKLGAGKDYDMWCCWNALMQARAMVENDAQ
jgi:hypothetical protein